MKMLKKCKTILFIFALILISSGCSNDSNVKKFSTAIQDSSIGDSKISYNDKDWYDFVKQDSKIQDYYVEYLNEIGECLLDIELEKADENEFDGTDTIIIKLNKNNKYYEFNLKNIYPDTSCLKVTIDDKTEYYLLDKENSEKLSDIILESETRPFNHISLLEYLQNEDS